jgi:YfiH family protein
LIDQVRENAHFLQFSNLLSFPEITHGIFTRKGGYSQAPFNGVNVSLSTGDVVDDVLRNRLLVLQTLGIENDPCATLWQVHGADVAVLDPDNEVWDDWRDDWAHRSYEVDGQELVWTRRPRRKADAILTRKQHVTLALSFADCTPILLYDPVEHVIGIAHGGWRGTVRGIALAVVEAMNQHYGCEPHNIFAGLAPSIGPCCYEVSAYVRDLFQGDEQFSEMPTQERYRDAVRASAAFSMKQRADRPEPTLHLDLWETNHNQLVLAGLLPEHIELPGVCTGCNTDLFFSHRIEQGKTGRFAVVLTLRNQA